METNKLVYTHFAQHIRRGVTTGLPEWYKQKLLEEQFNREGG